MFRVEHTDRWHGEMIDLKSHTDWSLTYVIDGLFLLGDPYSQLAGAIEWKRRFPSAASRCGSKRWAAAADAYAARVLEAADRETVARVEARLDAPDAEEES